jgi:1-acyl-sn-glycerol-3-phosphate acyltransferase
MPQVALAILAYVFSALVLFVWLPLTALLFVLTAPFDPNRALVGRFVRLSGALISRSFPPWRLRIEGQVPKGRAFVVVSNHQSFLDVFMLCNVPREMKWMAKESLHKTPWTGWMMRMAGDIALRRGDVSSASGALAKARAYLLRGMSVFVFAEGTRSKDGTLLPFKSGAFRLAIEAGAPVLPVVIEGTAGGMPKGSPWVRPTKAVARILEPIEVAGLGIPDVQRLRDEVRGRIEQELQKLRASEGGGGERRDPRAPLAL